MSRFVVGETYTFTRTLFEKGKDRFGSLYLPWVDTLKDIEVVNITCVSEHAVAWDQDPKGEKNNKGYLFTDDAGNKWANQYPTASYGQLDDSADRIVIRYFETPELLICGKNGEALKDSDNKYVRKEGTEELWAIFDSQFWSPFTLAETVLGSLYRGINSKVGFELDHKEQLRDYMEDVIKKVEQYSNKKVSFEPLIIKYTDGRPDKTSNYVQAVLS